MEAIISLLVVIAAHNGAGSFELSFPRYMQGRDCPHSASCGRFRYVAVVRSNASVFAYTEIMAKPQSCTEIKP